MADPLSSAAIETNVLDVLKQHQLRGNSVDIELRQEHHLGTVKLRQGQVVFAACGDFVGNGALLTLAAVRAGEIRTTAIVEAAENNISFGLPLVERLLEKAAPPPSLVALAQVEAEVEEANHLIHQFKRSEAAAKLVAVLRTNRYYYPAWLWHSRLLTRMDFLRKALAEARKWGNADPKVLREAAKIEPQLIESGETVKRCIYCRSLLIDGALRCRTCQGLLQLPETGTFGEPSRSAELVASLEAYQQESRLHPENDRIAYCLCLGQLSLGRLEEAEKWIDRTLAHNPQQSIFLKAKALLRQSRPAKLTAVIPPQPQPPSSPPVRATMSATGKTILVVEDSPTSRKVISMVLARRGHTIVEAKSGAEAMRFLDEKVPDLVLLDVMLPDMNGYEILTRLRQSPGSAEVPVVMLTGKNKPSDRLQGLFHGTNEYLTKPFDPSKLIGVLEKYLKGEAVPPKTPTPPASQPRPAAVGPDLAREVKNEPVAARKPEAPRTAARPPMAPPRPQSPPPPKPGGGSAKTVMVVEDSPTSRKVVSMVLAKGGYVVEEAPTAGAALRRLANMVPDLILLDAMLPDLSGYDVLAHLKNDARLQQVPVVMLTAKNNPMDRQKGLRSGLVAYLTKPFDPEKLLTVIKEHI
jgi:CheY-like chemotaxis protein